MKSTNSSRQSKTKSYAVRAPYEKEKVKKRDLRSKKDMMREMYACKDCDCETYPWCVNKYIGGICRECFDLESYTHKKALRSKPGLYGVDKKEISKLLTPIKIEYPYIKLIPTPLDGDCLYQSISKAFEGKITVEDLRYLVAQCQNNTTFQTYKELSGFMSEYRPIRGANSLRDFKILIKKTGEDVGCNNCVWGDENSLAIISTMFRLGFMIFNEKGSLIQEIYPERTSTFSTRDPSRYLLLLLNGSKSGQEHYNLLEFNHHTLLRPEEVSQISNLLSSTNTTRNAPTTRTTRTTREQRW